MSMAEKIGEALRLRAFMPDSREFIRLMADMFGARPISGDSEALYHFLETIYNAGRVEGIRQERRRRKEVAA